eukprot:5363338-Pleurochrysis_carterae.AAC.1
MASQATSTRAHLPARRGGRRRWRAAMAPITRAARVANLHGRVEPPDRLVAADSKQVAHAADGAPLSSPRTICLPALSL